MDNMDKTHTYDVKPLNKYTVGDEESAFPITLTFWWILLFTLILTSFIYIIWYSSNGIKHSNESPAYMR